MVKWKHGSLQNFYAPVRFRFRPHNSALDNETDYVISLVCQIPMGRREKEEDLHLL